MRFQNIIIKDSKITMLNLVRVIIVGWIIYEIVMAWILRAEFTERDWAALLAKLSYLIGLLIAALLGYNELGKYASTVSPGLAAAVRATQGWLGYTWFTVVLPLIGLASSLAEAKDKSKSGILLALFNGVVFAYMAVTLAGSVYQAPDAVRLGDIIIFAIAHPLSFILARRNLGIQWTTVHLASLLAVLAASLYWSPG